MIRKKFDNSRNTNSYYTNSSQYLTSRNRTFAQNQYNYILQGDSTAKPGTNLASANVYLPAGSNPNCQKFEFKNYATFKYLWINKYDTSPVPQIVNDTTLYSVNIAPGFYSLEDINRLFKQAMFSNFHFLIKNPAGTSNEYYSENITYPLQFAYNNNKSVVEIQSYRLDVDAFPATNHIIPTDQSNQKRWELPASGSGKYAQIVVESNDEFSNAIGFAPASYPATDTDVSNPTFQVFESNSSPGLKPFYVKLHYKPNNPQFAQQGAVSAGDLITRKKYNSITNSTAEYRNSFGGSVANALAYGVPTPGYTEKDKLGYPLKQTPTFSKYSDEMKKCSVTSFTNAI
jgi:hypothetical protein